MIATNTKDNVRKLAKNIHLSVGHSIIRRWDFLIQSKVQRFIDSQPHGTSFGWFYPIAFKEPEIFSLLKKYLEQKEDLWTHSMVCLEDRKLVFRLIDQNTAFINIQSNLLQPTKHSPVITPDIIFVPALGFNQKGYRLGWGQGSFDKLASTVGSETKLVGITYPWQRDLNFTEEQHDLLCSTIISG